MSGGTVTKSKRKEKKIYKTLYLSEIGTLEIAGSEDGIVSVTFVRKKPEKSSKIPLCLKSCVRQLDEYFRGKRKIFSLKLRLQGTDFQKRVWRELLKIPYGKTASYRDTARAVGREKAFRAVGNANHNNPVAIIIPCHRVIGSSGKLIGYGAGLWRKKWLLRHEKKVNAGM